MTEPVATFCQKTYGEELTVLNEITAPAQAELVLTAITEGAAGTTVHVLSFQRSAKTRTEGVSEAFSVDPPCIHKFPALSFQAPEIFFRYGGLFCAIGKFFVP